MDWPFKSNLHISENFDSESCLSALSITPGFEIYNTPLNRTNGVHKNRTLLRGKIWLGFSRVVTVPLIAIEIRPISLQNFTSK